MNGGTSRNSEQTTATSETSVSAAPTRLNRKTLQRLRVGDSAIAPFPTTVPAVGA